MASFVLTGFGIGYRFGLLCTKIKTQHTLISNCIRLFSRFSFVFFLPHRTWNAVASFLYAESNTNRNIVEEVKRKSIEVKKKKIILQSTNNVWINMHSECLTFNQPIKFYYVINYKAIFFQIKTTTHKRGSHLPFER